MLVNLKNDCYGGNMMRHSRVLMMIACCMAFSLQVKSAEEWGLELTQVEKYSLKEESEREDGFYFSHENTRSEATSFEQLPLSEKEEENIEKILHALGTCGVPELIWKQKELKRLGKSINHVHPLRFIEYIVSQPILRSDLQETHRNFFKWRAFLDGFRRRMTEEFYKGNLKQYLPGFCKALEIKQEVAEHFIDRRDWEGLVKAILY